MKDKAEEKSDFSNETSPEGKDRRRFLKQMTICAIAAPVIMVMPKMAAACSSGDSPYEPDKPDWPGWPGWHDKPHKPHKPHKK